MAAPTFTSITPDSGMPIGGYVVRIIGTDFELPPDPDPTGYVGGDVPETVQVELDGVLCEDVRVWSVTELTCLVPEYSGDPRALSADPGVSVDVTIRNLGPPEEEVTETDGFAYQRTDLARGYSGLAYVCEMLRKRMASDIIENIVLKSRGIDYHDPSAVSVYLATTPGIAMVGPRITEDLDYRAIAPIVKTVDTDTMTFERTVRPYWSKLSFSCALVTRGHGAELEMLNLISDFISFFNEKKYLKILTDPTDEDSSIADFPMMLIDPPSAEEVVSRAGIMGTLATFEIRKVPIDRDRRVVIESGLITEDEDHLDLQMESKELDE